MGTIEISGWTKFAARLEVASSIFLQYEEQNADGVALQFPELLLSAVKPIDHLDQLSWSTLVEC